MKVPLLALLRLKSPNERGTGAPQLAPSPETSIENLLAFESEDSNGHPGRLLFNCLEILVLGVLLVVVFLPRIKRSVKQQCGSNTR